MSTEPLIGVFIDYENLALGVRDMDGADKTTTLEIGLVLNRLLEKGRIVYKRAYCDWSNYRKATQTLHKHGIVMVDIPQTGVSGKNSADIHMVCDAMDLAYSKEHISVFALLSGDSDFSPLVHKLKENDKRVIGCGVKSSTSGLLVKSCDEFIYYDDLVKRAARRPQRKRTTKAPTKDDKQTEALDQVVEIVRSLHQDYENVWARWSSRRSAACIQASITSTTATKPSKRCFKISRNAAWLSSRRTKRAETIGFDCATLRYTQLRGLTAIPRNRTMSADVDRPVG